MKLNVTVNGSVYEVDVEVEEEPLPTLGSVQVGGGSAFGMTPTVAKAPGASSNALTAPMSGTVVKVLVESGADVKSGETMFVLEAMKMETEVTAPKDGKVKSIEIGVGDSVQSGQVLIEWED